VNEIHVMDANGANEVVLVSSPYPYINLDWAIDDSQIVYTMEDGIWQVNTVSPYEKTRLFQSTLPCVDLECSSDGKYILYASANIGSPQNLYLIDFEGNNYGQLTSSSTINYGIDWSYDSQSIIFAASGQIWKATITIINPKS
jgi:Tol biopolymer transport system component